MKGRARPGRQSSSPGLGGPSVQGAPNKVPTDLSGKRPGEGGTGAPEAEEGALGETEGARCEWLALSGLGFLGVAAGHRLHWDNLAQGREHRFGGK